jgi:hypothetical protein
VQTIILYPNAQRVEALVLSIGRNAIRVVHPQTADTVELRRSRGQWADESGVPIEFESFIAAADFDIRSILEMPQAYPVAS